jgi:phage portal protein BeeE
MGILETMGLKAIKVSPEPNASKDIGDIYVSPSMSEQGIFKAYIPKYMYRPPFGYPRAENLALMQTLSKNPYIYSVIKTIQDEVALAKWEIAYKEDSELKDKDSLKEQIQEIINFFNNPNRNKESFVALRAAMTRDILSYDSGVWVKVFNGLGRFCEMYCRDGKSFLKNCDIYGYMGNRADYVKPMEMNLYGSNMPNTPSEFVKQYQMNYSEEAAYFQYGTSVAASIPIPFGRREIVYVMQNPQSDTPYGLSPVGVLADIIMTLVYGANFNLDYYMNNNMPEGIIQLLQADADEIRAFRSRMEKEFRVKDEVTGFMRKVGYKVPITSREVNFVPFQLDPKTMQIIEQQSWFYKLVLAVFGIPPDEMGLTENSNRATGVNQYRVFLRKSARAIMQEIKYKIDNEIIAEWGQEVYKNVEFKWNDYDLDEEIKKYGLYQTKINLGVMSPEMIADKEGIDYFKVQEWQKEKQQQEIDKMRAGQMNINQNFGSSMQPEKNPDEPNKESSNILDELRSKYGQKSIQPETLAEKQIIKIIDANTKKIINALDTI